MTFCCEISSDAIVGELMFGFSKNALRGFFKRANSDPRFVKGFRSDPVLPQESQKYWGGDSDYPPPPPPQA